MLNIKKIAYLNAKMLIAPWDQYQIVLVGVFFKYGVTVL